MDCDVQRIVGYDQRKDIVYYIAACPLPRNRHLYRVGPVGSANENPQCVSCWMDCSDVGASFGADTDIFLLSCNGPGRPRQFLNRISTNQTLMVINNNTELGKRLVDRALPTLLYTSVALEQGYEALVKLDLPPGLNPDSPLEVFPMILRVYAGPGNQEVRETYRMDFDSYLTSCRRYIVAHIDARGSGNRGWKYLFPLYRSFGVLEIEDQIKAVELLLEKYSFINKNKVAVWGWSYGGFAAAKILVKDRKTTFRCAASVAPVTNFKYYDAAYTERYMGLPQYSYEAYDKTDITKNVTAFRNRNYLLIHGTADDNVHFQNTAMLVKALTKANVQFKLMMYPNQDHSILKNRPHLYTLLDNYFEKCFTG